MRRRHSTRLVAGFVAGLALAAAAAWITERYFERSERAHTNYENTEHGIYALRDVLLPILSVNSQVQRYLITGDSRDLTRVNATLGLARYHLQRLHALIDDDPIQNPSLNRLDALIRRHAASVERAVGIGNQTALATHRTQVLLVEPARLAEDIYGVTSVIEVRARVFLKDRLATEQRDAGTTRSLTTLVSALSLFLLVAVFTAALNESVRRRDAQATAEQSAAHVHNLYNGAPCGYQSLDASGTIVAINDTELSWIGYARDEIVSKVNFKDLLTKISQPAFTAAFGHLVTDGAISNLELELIRKNGTVIPVLMSATAVYDEHGQFVQSRSTLFDITERRQAEEDRDRFFSLSVDMLAIADFNGYFKRLNAAFTATLGYTVDELLARPFLDFVHPDDRHATVAEMRKLAEGATSLRFENRYACKDGSWRWLSWTSQPVRETGLLYATARDVTDLKKAHDSIQESNEWLRVTLNSIGDAVLCTDVDGRITGMNPVAETLTGWTWQEAAGRPVDDVFVAVDENTDAVLRLPIHDSLTIGETQTLAPNTILIGRDGARRPVTDSVAPIRDDTGNIRGAVVVFRDVSQQRLEQRRYRTILETSIDGFCIADSTGRFVSVNQAYCDMTGYTRDELLSMRADEIEAADTREATRARMQKVATFGSDRFETRLRRKDGTTFYVDVSAQFSVDMGGVFVAFIKDITKRKTAERELLDMKAALDHHAIVAITDASGHITHVNDKFCSVSGYTRDELIGRDHKIVRSPDVPTDTIRDLWETITAGRVWQHTMKIRTKDGTPRWLDTTVVPFLGPDGIPAQYIAIRTDVTNSVTVMAELEQARQDAEAASQVKSQFLAAMSHEIRTPMNGVVGMIDVLQNTSLRGDQVEMVDLIRDSALSLLTIIDDVLDFSKIEAGRMDAEQAPMSISDVVSKTCRVLDRGAAKKGVELRLFVDPAIPHHVTGDALRLRQVLLNLANNAVKFADMTKPKRLVSLRATLVSDSGDSVRVKFTVADNGIGMTESVVSRLFNPFTQGDASTTRRYGGTGLGLTISRHLAHLMGGTITVASVPGEGSTFTVELPFAAPRCERESESDVALPDNLCCVVVGTDSGLAPDLSQYLAATGVPITRHADLADAAASLTAHPESKCLWIVDFESPPQPSDLHDIADSYASGHLRFLVIGRGQRRKVRMVSDRIAAIDGNVLDRRTFLRAVAVASGSVHPGDEDGKRDKPSASPRPSSREEAIRQGRLILVAEDNEMNQQVILRQLSLLGFTADIAPDGQAALERWRSGDYALVLADIHMPRMDGYELTAQIRALEGTTTRTPIVALTANALSGEADRCRLIGMDDYLTKPAQLADLRAVIDKWLPVGHDSSQQEPASSAMPSNSPVDVSVLENFIGNDPALVTKFLKAFQSTATGTATRLKTSSNAGELPEVRAAAHKLKSSARSVGAIDLGDLCAEIENAAAAGESDRVTDLLLRFEAEYASVESYLQSVLTT